MTEYLAPLFSTPDRRAPGGGRFRWPAATRALVAALGCALLAACSGGGGGGGGGGGDAQCTFGNGGPANLTVADVNRILAQAANEAIGRGAVATIAVTDRTGNVLAVARTGGATTDTITSAPRVLPGPSLAVPTTLENAAAPLVSSDLTAIAKAVTGAYLSSNGNAFSSRTASYIVQETFPPNLVASPFAGGPLFGVQFSQLPCGDLIRDVTSGSIGGAAGPGPHRSPLGLSADPGGLPLYKNGTLVGGIGISADRTYGLDRNPFDFDTNDDEIIALAGSTGFEAPECIRANRILVVGQALRYIDANSGQFARPVSATGAFTVTAVTGYFAGTVRDGTTFGTVASGIAREGSAGEAIALPEVTAFTLYDNAGARRFAPAAGTDTPTVGALTAAEVSRLLTEAIKVAFRGRAQIRRPLNSHIEVTVSVVDTNGAILGVARTPDAPVFGTDVSLQKARSAMFFSSPFGSDINIASGLKAQYLDPAVAFLNSGGHPATVTAFPSPSFAFAARSVGNLSRPFFPDGDTNETNGPLSLPFDAAHRSGFTPATTVFWSPFGTGLQLDLVFADVVGRLPGGGGTLGAAPAAPFCGSAGAPPTLATGGAGITRLANGLQIFSGGVPLYRGSTLIGAIGVSGDGIDQDDMVAFLGADGAGAILGTLGNAPQAIRADNFTPENKGNLRYVNCPSQPFLDSDATDPCSGK